MFWPGTWRATRMDGPRAARSIVVEAGHELAELAIVDRATRTLGLDAGLTQIDHIDAFHLSSP